LFQKSKHFSVTIYRDTANSLTQIHVIENTASTSYMFLFGL